MSNFDHLKEIQKSSELIFNGRLLKVWRDIVELSNGLTSFREYIKHPGAACVVPVLANGNLVMIQQFRYSVGQVFLEFPAGKKDKGESSEQTAHRELLEEVGYKATKMTYLTKIHPVIGYANEQIDLFLAEDLIKDEQKLDHDERLEVIEVSPDDLKKKILDHQVTDVKTQIAAFWYFEKLRNQ